MHALEGKISSLLSSKASHSRHYAIMDYGCFEDIVNNDIIVPEFIDSYTLGAINSGIR